MLSSLARGASDKLWHVVILQGTTDNDTIDLTHKPLTCRKNKTNGKCFLPFQAIASQPVIFPSSDLRREHSFQCVQSLARAGSAWQKMWLARIFISMCLGDRQHVPSVDPHTIIRYLVDASIKGHADAMYMLGVASFRVDPCRQIISERQARVWMEKAAAKSCIFAHVFQSSSDIGQ